MKHLKNSKMFNEATRFPQLAKGMIIVFSDSDIDTDFVKRIAKKLGCTCSGEQYDNGYVINTPPGKEEEVGKQFVEDYPEFFTSYERHDLNQEHIYSECDQIIDSIEVLRDSMGTFNEFGKALLPDSWNESIDKIIKRLSDLKHE